MISRQTVEAIWKAQREIEAAEKLLVDVAEIAKNLKRDPNAEKIRDSFGRPNNLQLGIPSGENSHRLFDVSYSLAESIIKVHIENQKAALAEANEQARLELGIQQ